MKIDFPFKDRNPWVRALGVLLFAVLSLLSLATGIVAVTLAAVFLLVLFVFTLFLDFVDTFFLTPGAYILFTLLKLPRP